MVFPKKIPPFRWGNRTLPLEGGILHLMEATTEEHIRAGQEEACRWRTAARDSHRENVRPARAQLESDDSF